MLTGQRRDFPPPILFLGALLLLAACESGGGGGGVCGRGHVDAGGSDGDCIRSLVPGAARFWSARSRVAAGAESRLRLIDMDPEGHATWVRNVAQRLAFADVPAAAITGSTVDGRDIAMRITELPAPASNNYVVNLSIAPLFTDENNLGGVAGADIPASLLTQKGAVYVIGAGNSSTGFSHGRTQAEQAMATRLVLFVAGLDYANLRGGVYVKDADASPCQWAKLYCVMASYSTPIPGDPVHDDADRYHGSSFSAPQVSSLLANARLLWPSMTSRQTVDLARFCARPINEDGSLGDYGETLSESQASDIWGQGVFSVECLYDRSGALFNPITGTRLGARDTGRRLSGEIVFNGARANLFLRDIFSRDFSFSRPWSAPLLSFAPEHVAGLYGTEEGVFGLAWRGIALAARIEKNGFFGSYGFHDFALGDTFAVIAQAGHRFHLSEGWRLSLFGQSSWGRMRAAPRSLVIGARGHAHQLMASADYDGERTHFEISVLHHFGVRGRLRLLDFGDFSFAPRRRSVIQLRVSHLF